MSDPQVFIDYEFHFANGQMLSCTIQRGRDVELIDPQHISLEVRHSEVFVEKMLVMQDKLVAVRQTERTVQHEPEA